MDKKKPQIDDDNDNENDELNYNNRNKTLFNTNNILLFIIIYIVSTIICFYTFTSSFNINSLVPLFLLDLVKIPEPIKQEKLINNIDIEEIDPKVLNKINDNINIGFNPPNMNDDDDKDDNNDINNNNDKDDNKYKK